MASRLLSSLLPSLAMLLVCIVATPRAHADLRVVGGMVRITDAPNAMFDISGWHHGSESNPLVLTQDFIGNAFVAVSRPRRGRSDLGYGVDLPDAFDPAHLQPAVQQRLRSKHEVRISSEVIGVHTVVVAHYLDGQNEAIEFVFPHADALVHVLGIARPGRYFVATEAAARRVVETFAPLGD